MNKSKPGIEPGSSEYYSQHTVKPPEYGRVQIRLGIHVLYVLRHNHASVRVISRYVPEKMLRYLTGLIRHWNREYFKAYMQLSKGRGMTKYV